MKASELRIDNLVFNETTREDMRVYPMLIQQLSNIKGECNIKPIPLTEEWLLKFGFEYDKDDDWFIFESEKGISISHIIDGLTHYFSNLECVWADILNEIKYVHQLQNLYHALTGEELKLQEL